MTTTIRIISALLALFFAGASHAQTTPPNYPTRPVRVIVAYPPGGPTDLIARVVAQKMSEHFGQQFYVENLAGAGGAIGAGIAANAPPDGHTLFITTNDFAVGATTTKLSYDPVKNFAPISIVTTVDVGGTVTGMTMLQQAVWAIDAGHCRNVVCVFGENPQTSRPPDTHGFMLKNALGGEEWEEPFGLQGMVMMYSLTAQRYIHETGATIEDFGAVAVSARQHALLNDNAVMKKPITLEDHRNSRDDSFAAAAARLLCRHRRRRRAGAHQHRTGSTHGRAGGARPLDGDARHA